MHGSPSAEPRTEETVKKPCRSPRTGTSLAPITLRVQGPGLKFLLSACAMQRAEGLDGMLKVSRKSVKDHTASQSRPVTRALWEHPQRNVDREGDGP
jgi:hypothetical protein